MNDFKAFMKDSVAKIENVKVEVSNRFSVPFEIKALDQNDIEKLKDSSRKKVKGERGKITYGEVDFDLFLKKLITESIVVPDLKNREIQESYGTLGSAEDTLGKMITYGEYAKLGEEVTILSGLADEEELAEAIEEAKN